MMQIAVLALLALGSATSTERDLTPALEGSWGGPRAQLMVGTLDADVQVDCSEGTIYGPYMVKKDGSFAWSGRFSRERETLGRPEQNEVDATYEGQIRGGNLTFEVKIDGGRALGPYTVQRFKDADLPECN
ncbi:MAG TPA: hypothetical protein VKC17_11990 [Sphingomicrobium sp.]|nr:hypothetical protein [Sphingomicrobium sp.]